MTRPLIRVLVCLVLPALAWLAPARARAAAPAGPDTLADSTWVDRWTLKNGLQVTARHIPGSVGVAVVMAYRVGRDQDPKGREGMADVLCEVLLTAATAEEPERTREQMNDLRKLGWNLQVAPRFSLVSEVAPPRQFPGVLRLMAARMRGVTVTDSVLDRARRTALREQGERFVGTAELALLSQMRTVALGVSDEELARRLSGATLKGLSAAEAGERLRKLYVPANAVLALAGDLERVDLHALVASLFEGIPGGTAVIEPPPAKMTAAERAVRRPDLSRPIAGVGIISPPITDPQHANFYLNALVLGEFADQEWGQAEPPLPYRFRYPVLADPQLVQFFPPVPPGPTDLQVAGGLVHELIQKLAVTAVGNSTFQEMRTNHQWLFGGPFPPVLKSHMGGHAGSLHTLAVTLAVRAMWGSDAFWKQYLTRFLEKRQSGAEFWIDYYQAPANMVRLQLNP